jgi:CRP-like cAMP-binding protein
MTAQAPFSAPDLLTRLFSGKGPRHISGNHWLINQGDHVENVYVVESGLAMEFALLKSTVQPMCFCPPGTMTGIRWSVHGIPRYEHSTIALRPTIVRPLPLSAYLEAQNIDAEFRTALMKDMLRRLECSRTIADTSPIRPSNSDVRHAIHRNSTGLTNEDVQRVLPSLLPLLDRLVDKGLIPHLAADI